MCITALSLYFYFTFALPKNSRCLDGHRQSDEVCFRSSDMVSFRVNSEMHNVFRLGYTKVSQHLDISDKE